MNFPPFANLLKVDPYLTFYPFRDKEDEINAVNNLFDHVTEHNGVLGFARDTNFRAVNVIELLYTV